MGGCRKSAVACQLFCRLAPATVGTVPGAAVSPAGRSRKSSARLGRKSCRTLVGARTWRSRRGGTGLGKRQQRDVVGRRHRGLDGELGQQRDADAGGHHLAQRLEAGGPEAAALGRAGQLAHRRAPGRAGSGPPRAAARARRRAPTRSTGPVDGRRAGGRRARPARSPRRRGAPRAAGRRGPGRARTPTSRRPSRSRCRTTSVFSSTSSSSRFGERARARRARRGAAGTAPSVGNSPRRSVPDSGSWPGGRCRSMLSVSREDDPGPLDDPLAGLGQQRSWRGLRSISSTPSSRLELLDLGRQRRLADEAGLGGPAEVAVLGDGDEVAEVAQVHRASGRRSTRSPRSVPPVARRAGSLAAAVGARRRGRGADQVVEGAEGGGRAGAHGDDDLLVRHRGAVAGGEHAGHRGLAPVVDDDLAPRRQLDRALEPLGVRQQADLHEDAVEVDRVVRRRSSRSS